MMSSFTLNLAVTALMVFVPHVDALTNSEKCSLRAETGRGEAYFERWYYNNVEGVCKTFIFGGGNPVNDNNFNSEDDCLEFCNRETVCAPFEVDPTKPYCTAAFQRYKYNSDTNSCELFIYGGCGGNANNFGTRAACETKCVQT